MVNFKGGIGDLSKALSTLPDVGRWSLNQPSPTELQGSMEGTKSWNVSHDPNTDKFSIGFQDKPNKFTGLSFNDAYSILSGVVKNNKFQGGITQFEDEDYDDEEEEDDEMDYDEHYGTIDGIDVQWNPSHIDEDSADLKTLLDLGRKMKGAGIKLVSIGDDDNGNGTIDIPHIREFGKNRGKDGLLFIGKYGNEWVVEENYIYQDDMDEDLHIYYEGPDMQEALKIMIKTLTGQDYLPVRHPTPGEERLEEEDEDTDSDDEDDEDYEDEEVIEPMKDIDEAKYDMTQLGGENGLIAYANAGLDADEEYCSQFDYWSELVDSFSEYDTCPGNYLNKVITKLRETRRDEDANALNELSDAFDSASGFDEYGSALKQAREILAKYADEPLMVRRPTPGEERLEVEDEMDNVAKKITKLLGLEARVGTGGEGVFVHMPDGSDTFIEFGASEDGEEFAIYPNYLSGLSKHYRAITEGDVITYVRLLAKEPQERRQMPGEERLEDMDTELSGKLSGYLGLATKIGKDRLDQLLQGHEELVKWMPPGWQRHKTAPFANIFHSGKLGITTQITEQGLGASVWDRTNPKQPTKLAEKYSDNIGEINTFLRPYINKQLYSVNERGVDMMEEDYFEAEVQNIENCAKAPIKKVKKKEVKEEKKEASFLDLAIAAIEKEEDNPKNGTVDLTKPKQDRGETETNPQQMQTKKQMRKIKKTTKQPKSD